MTRPFKSPNTNTSPGLIFFAGRANAKKLRRVIRKANEDAKGTMSRKGVTVVQTPIAMVDEITKKSTEMWNELAGKIYSKDELKMVLDARDEYRAKHKTAAAPTPGTGAK